MEDSVTQDTKYYLGDYEVKIDAQGHQRKMNYLYGGDGLFAIYVQNNGADTMYYVQKNYLGSYYCITDNNGNIATLDGQQQVYSFDPWGRRRNATTWTYNNVPQNFLFDRGFTGQEHLDAFGLINMNGRSYDPWLGRMLSVDPFVQDMASTQSFNSYTYASNNPFKYVDPSGYFINFAGVKPIQDGGGAGSNASLLDEESLNWAAGVGMGSGGSWGAAPGSGSYFPTPGMAGFQTFGDINSHRYFYDKNRGWVDENLNPVGWSTVNNALAPSVSKTYKLNSVPKASIDLSMNALLSGQIGYKYLDPASSEINSRGQHIGFGVIDAMASGVVPGAQDFSLGLMYEHFQIGKGRALMILMSSIHFGPGSRRALGLEGLKVGHITSVNLFNLGATNPVALAFGRVHMEYLGNNQYTIVGDKSSRFDFNPLFDLNASLGRNAGNALGATINYDLFLGPLGPIIPMIWGGPYNVYFTGSTTIP